MVVVSASTSPLSTDVPIPTDGQPEWWRCECGHRSRFAPEVTRAVHSHGGAAAGNPMERDGPFPFTVAVWNEVEDRSSCEAAPTVADVGGCGCGDEDHCLFGAITHLVVVTGPSHQGNHEFGRWTWCPPRDEPDRWHTPTRAVTPIDPIPCDRPWRCSTCPPGDVYETPQHGRCYATAHGDHDWHHPSVWVADDDLAATSQAIEH